MLGADCDPSAAIEVSLGGLPPKGVSLRGERRSGLELRGGVGGLREAHEALASARALGGRRPLADPSAAIEVSLGGLPPKGEVSEGERRSGSGPDCVYFWSQKGLEDYGKRMKL